MKHRGIRVRSPFDRAAGPNQGTASIRRKKESCKIAPLRRCETAAGAALRLLLASLPRRLQPRDQLVEPQLLEPLPDRLQLRGGVLDQLAPLAAKVECVAEARLASVELLDDLLYAVDRRLVT